MSTIENVKENESENESDNLMSSSQHILSNCQESLSSIPQDQQTMQKARKARNTFPLPLLNVSTSSINNKEQISTPLSSSAHSPTLKSNNVSGAYSTSSVERRCLRRRFARLREVTPSNADLDDLLQCDTPKSKTLIRPFSQRSSNELGNKTERA
ncbi:hypothetical protein TSAR_004473 [Trichomalopsis sarcophagae]|uniref:Uncharacterized protein n=1 Tax=Trichomalopsis sarcophagae TaxID=543379 RepID=A0A232ET17_9HYME|nr:hypothetical protein TSAR_004473 [Trichomalopsis sarcophagae]